MAGRVRPRFSTCDVTVISILWSYEIFSNAISKYCLFSWEVISQNEQESIHFKRNDTAIIFTKCLMALVVGFLVDAYGRKYLVSFWGLCIYSLTPFVALWTCFTRAVLPAMILFWIVSVTFIASPATFCLVFNQKLFADRRQVRQLVSIVEFMDSLCSYFMFLSIPDPYATKDYSIVVVWVIVISLHVFLFTIFERIKSYVKGDFRGEERTVKAILRGIWLDIQRKTPQGTGRSVSHVTFFVMLLLPALTLSILDSAMPTDTDDVHPTLANITHLVKLLTIPLLEVILSLAKRLKEFTSEMALLGLVHTINIVVLVLLLMKMTQPIETAAISFMHGIHARAAPISHSYNFPPKPGKIAYLIMNHATVDVEVTTYPNIISNTGSPWRAPPGNKLLTLKNIIPGELNVSFSTVVDDPKSANPPSDHANVRLKAGLFYTFLLIGNESKIELVTISGIEHVEKWPTIVVTNTIDYVNGIQVSDGEIQINSTETGFHDFYSLSPVGEKLEVRIPKGNYSVMYRYMGTNPDLRKLLNDDSVVVNAEEYSVYLVYLSREDGFTSIKLYSDVPEEPPTAEEPRKKPPDAMMMSSYGLKGAAQGVASVGYIHFFWTEAPLRLRATLFALFRVSNVLVGWGAERVVEDGLSLVHVSSLLTLQVLTSVWHLGVSWVFQIKVYRE